MEDDPVKLPAERLVKVLGIVPNPVDADIDLPHNGLTGFGKVKSDDVGVVIMLQVCLVNFQQGLIRTKDIIHCNKRLLFFAEKGCDECLQPASLF